MAHKCTPFFSAGTVVHDKARRCAYTLETLIGYGAFAQCYSAKSSLPEHGGRVALKVIKFNEIRSSTVKDKVRSEIEIHRKLNHKNIVRMYGSFKGDEYIFIVLELCENGGLDELLKKQKVMSASQVRRFTAQILDALEYLHDEMSIIHRDIKLGNIFLDRGYNVKIGDFGLAAEVKEGQKKKTICGTPNYIAPEVLFDKENGHSFEVDIWSLGIIMYTLLVGIPPFHKRELKEIYKSIEANNYIFPESSNISEDVKTLISSILTTNPVERPSIPEIRSSAFMRRKQGQFAMILDDLKNSTVKFPNIDFLIFSIPLSKLKGVGYILASGYHGIYFNDHTNILYRPNDDDLIYIGVKVEGLRRILKKEVYTINMVPDGLRDRYNKLLYFIDNFGKETEWQVSSSFITRIKRMENGLLHRLYNGMIVLDYNDGLKIYVYDGGRFVYATRDNVEIDFTNEMMKMCITVLSNS